MEIIGKYILIIIIMSIFGGSIKKIVDKIKEDIRKIIERKKKDDKE